MSDSSYITKLRESQTLVASRFVPRVINNVVTNNSPSVLLPTGFTFQNILGNTVDVNINGNLNVTQNLNVDGGIDPIYLQLRPQTGTTLPFTEKGTLWVQTYTESPNRYTLKLDNNTIYDTTNTHLGSINTIQFTTINSTNIITNNITHSLTNNSKNITVTGHLIPTIDAQNEDGSRIDGGGFNLGSDQSWWDTIYVRDVVQATGTTYIVGENGKQMKITYDIDKGTSLITKDNVTVETVTTSRNIPGQIDPSLLPFSGLAFASKINITEYKNNVSNSLVNQLLYSIYTLDKTIITTNFEIPTNNPECNITKITELLNGNYYVVINSNKSTEQIKLPKIKASTNFATSSGALNITSPFTIVSEELVNITDGDILIIYYSYIPNGTEIDIIFGFQNINFRLPINSVDNTNILDNTLTSTKLKDNIITNNKIANASISLRTLSDEVINYINANTRDNNQISSIVCICNDLENKFNKIEKYIKILSNTYYIKDTLSDTTITLDNIDQIDLN